MLPVQLHMPLHRDHRHPERLHDLFGFHGPTGDHLAGEHTETPHIFLLMLEHRQVTVQIKHPARLCLYRDLAIDLRHPGRKNRQLQLRHPSLLPQCSPLLQIPLRIIPFSLIGENYWARSGDLTLAFLGGSAFSVAVAWTDYRFSIVDVVMVPAPFGVDDRRHDMNPLAALT